MVRKSGFTLLELIIVITVVGILSAISMASLSNIKEQAIDKEAKANLKLIVAAEKSYRMESSPASYYGSTDIDNINTNLKLSLPSGTNRNWNYTVYSATGAGCAKRNSATATNRWTFGVSDADGEPDGPTSASCP